MVPKSKSIWQPEPIDLNNGNGNLLRTVCRLSWWSQNSWRQKEKTVELESEELLETVGNYQPLQSVHARGVNQIEECSWGENETQLLLDVCEAILFPMDDLQLAFSNVPTIFTAKHLCTEDALSWRSKVNTCGFTLNWITPRLWPPPPGLLWPAPP